MKNLKFVVLYLCLMCTVSGYATSFTRSQIVSYASSLKGKKKSELKTAIYNLCQPKSVLSYGSGSGATWSGFVQTDRIGTTLECRNRYSTDRYYFTSTSQTSAISGMNIEHSFPKSWWGGSTNNAYKDLFNLYPSESTSNSYKSNYPMGKVTNATHSDYEIVGTGTAGSLGTIQLCEPNDTWKGDFCRSYFYMATIYQNLTWSGTQGLQELENDTWPTLREWAYTLYLEWTKTDRVTDIEVDRNNAVYSIQSNRNLFIDFPELAEYVWGDSIDVAFDPTTSLTSASDDSRFATYQAGNYESGASSGGSTTTETATAPTLTSSASFTTDTYSVTITNKESGATVYYTTDGTTPTTSSSSFTGTSKSLTISATTTVKAMAVISGKNNSSVTSATYTKTSSGDTDTDTGDSETATIVISELSTANSWTNGTAYTSVSSSPFTLTVSGGGNNGKFYTSDTTWRFYSGGSLSISAASGYTITSVTSSPSATFTVSNGVATASFSSTVRIETITITYTKDTSTQQTPTFALGTYKTAMTVGDAADTYSVTTNSDGALSATSSSTGVATVSVSGTKVTVTPVAAGTTTITVSAAETTAYAAASKSYTLTVSAAAVTLSSIALSGSYPTSFTQGDTFSHGGMTVTATYSDGSTKDVTSGAAFSGYDMSTTGTKTVTVSYTEGSKTVTATYSITVNDNTVLTPLNCETVDFTEVYSSVTGYSSTTITDYTGTSFTMAFAKPSSSSTYTKYYANGTAVRAYTGNTITITGASEIVKVVVNYVSGYEDNAATTTIDGTSALITFSKTCRFTSIKVIYAVPGDVDVDGDVDMDDLTLLSTYLIGTNTTTITAQGLINAELSGDSTLNIVDLAKLVELLNK